MFYGKVFWYIVEAIDEKKMEESCSKFLSANKIIFFCVRVKLINLTRREIYLSCNSFY